MTYAPAKSEVAASNILGGDAFTTKYIIYTKCCLVPSPSCDLCTCVVCNCYIQLFRRIFIYKKIHYMTLTLGSEKYCPILSTSRDISTCKVLSCCLTFDLDLEVKVTLNIAQYSLHHVIYASAKFKNAGSNDLEGTITRNMMDGQTYGRTDDGPILVLTWMDVLQ